MKKTLILLVAGSLVFSALPMSFANSTTAFTDDTTSLYDEGWTFTFEDFMKGLKLETLSNAQKLELETTFDNAVKYEDEGKYEEACKEWEKLDQLLIKYFPNDFKDFKADGENEIIYTQGYENMSFDDFMAMEKDFLKAIDAKDLATLKAAYEAMQAAITSKDDAKIKVTEKDFWELLDKHFDDEIIAVSGVLENANPLSFDDFIAVEKEFLLNVNDNDMKLLKDLYEAAMKLEDDSFHNAFDKFYDELEKHYDYSKIYADKDLVSMLNDLPLSNAEKVELTSLFKTLTQAIASKDQAKTLAAVAAFEAKLSANYDKYFPIKAEELGDIDEYDKVETSIDQDIHQFIASKNNNIKPISETDLTIIRGLYKEAMAHKDANQISKMNDKVDAIVKIINTYAK